VCVKSLKESELKSSGGIVPCDLWNRDQEKLRTGKASERKDSSRGRESTT
jgi:hypothetical protein